MTTSSVTPQDIRRALLLRQEIALLDVRHEAAFATGHPLFAANMAADRIAIEAALRLPRKNAPIVLYDDGEGLTAEAAAQLTALGYTNVRVLAGGFRPGAMRATKSSRTSTPTPRHLASWSRRAATRLRSAPTRLPRSSLTRPTSRSSMSGVSTNTRP
jgi:rhodanese-related sulfurtransferase